uniref:Adenylate cyclase (EC) n=1 Tax=uncultured Thiotrichaceae bacterium TaxID=298394 RepID=A0A6S6TQ41_9GAMM|nr:MAG: Adenylate cyclase (EC [uncultured Thiotrichaceae bacterium]
MGAAGTGLDSQIPVNGFKLEPLLTISLALARELSKLHATNTLHNGIKPANVIIEPDSLTVRFSNLETATRFSRNTNPSNSLTREEMLAYVSPERCRRIESLIDDRSDLYSLGVTLFQLASGKLPFISKDKGDLVHAHIAQAPPQLKHIRPDLPDVFSNIVAKLLEKNMEDRYESATGLVHDLEHCAAEIQRTGTIRLFKIAENDIPAYFRIPDKLYGREIELEQLSNAFESCQQGKRTLVTVSGMSGVGKTALVHAMQKSIIRDNGLYTIGKPDQFQPDQPYLALIQAARLMLKQVLSEPEKKLQSIKKALQYQLGTQGKLLTEGIPELELIIGPQPDIEDVSYLDAERRFNGVVARFLSVFATAQTPLVIFIDDLQWADAASYRLLHFLAGHSALNHLMFVFGYRTNELGIGHPAIDVISAFQSSVAVHHEVKIEPLTKADISTMLSETLHCHVNKVHPTSEYLYKLTEGNAFFIREFLQALHTRGFFKINRAENKWEWDLTAIIDQSLPDTVTELLTARLAEIPETCLNLLDTASCIGSEFDLYTLSSVQEISLSLVSRQIAPAVDSGLLVPLANVYWNVDSLNAGDHQFKSVASPRYRFQHDQVRETVHARLDEAQRTELHTIIGGLLVKNLSVDELNSQTVEVFSHLFYCVHSEQDKIKRKRYAQLGLVAGRMTYQRLAFSTASSQLEVAAQFLPDNCWKTDYQLSLDIFMLQAECAYALEQTAEFEKISSHILENVTSAIDTARIQSLRIRRLLTETKYDEAVDVTINVVKSLGIKIPRKPHTTHVLSGVTQVLMAQRGREPATFENLPEMSDQEMTEAIGVLTSAASAAYFAEPNLLPLIGIISTHRSIKHGLTPSSSYGFAVWALILCGVLGRIDTGYKFGNLALNVGKRYGGVDESRGRFVAHCFIKHWKDPLKDVCGFLYKDWGLNKDAGDEESAVYCIGVLLYTAFFSGGALDADKKYEPAVQYLLESNKPHVKHSFLAWVQLHEHLRAAELPEDLDGDWFSLTEKLPEFERTNNGVQIAISLTAAGILDFFAQRYERAASRFEIVAANEDKIVAQVLIPGLAFFRALNAYRLYAIQPKPKWLKIARKQTSRIRKWAKHSSVNLDHRLSLLQAEAFLIKGNAAEAVMSLHTAYEQATDNGKMYQALAAKRLEEVLLSTGSRSQADLMNTNAHQCFKEWGLGVSNIKGQPDLNPESTYSFENNDLQSLLSAMGDISSEINRETLLKKLMASLMQAGSADRGLLILMDNDDKPIIEIDTRFDGEWINPHVPLKGFHQVARPILSYAMRTHEIVVVNDAQNDDRLANDTYIKTKQVRALLASTIQIQGRLIGLIYLENSVARGAFNTHRVQIIKALAAQAGIALENAKLYSGMQETLEQQRVLNAANKRFVPEEIFTSLGYGSIVDVNLNEAIERDMNIVFVDLRSFTSISLDLGAKKTIAMINRYLSHIQPGILTHKGFVGNYMGDAVLAVFPNDADNALQGAITMSRGLMGYNRDRGDFPKLDFGIGIHSGPVTLGMIGDIDHIQCGVIGDSVNASSRIEGLTTFYGTTAIISQTTYDRLMAPERFAVRWLGRVELEGRSEVTGIYELLDVFPEDVKNKIQSNEIEFEQALDLYTRGYWHKSYHLFKKLNKQCPEDQVSLRYAQRCKVRLSAQLHWDGIEKPRKAH